MTKRPPIPKYEKTLILDEAWNDNNYVYAPNEIDDRLGLSERLEHKLVDMQQNVMDLTNK